MTRNLMIGMTLFTLTSASAFAAPAAVHQSKAKVVAQAPAGDSAAPSSDKPADKSTKKTPKHTKKAKSDASKSETKTEMKTDAPATK
jgi:hypothetical protein